MSDEQKPISIATERQRMALQAAFDALGQIAGQTGLTLLEVGTAFEMAAQHTRVMAHQAFAQQAQQQGPRIAVADPEDLFKLRDQRNGGKPRR